MLIQQGDVLLKSVKSINLKDLKKVDKRVCGMKQFPRFILAEGEVTGHCHAICDDFVELYEDKDHNLFMVNTDTTVVTHEEHNKVEVPTGIWEIGIVKEYDHFEEVARKVAD